MRDTLGHRVALLVPKDNSVTIVEIDEQLAFENQEELVLVIMLVPVELALDDPEPYDGVVDRGQGLVEPGFVGLYLRRDVDQREAAVLVIEVNVVVALWSAPGSADTVDLPREIRSRASEVRRLGWS